MAKKSATRSESMKKRCADPEYRAKMSEARRKQWENPEYRERMSGARSRFAKTRSGETAPYYIHGMSRTPEYSAYFSAKQRCTNPKNPKYCDYGGRGIKFTFTSFEQFITEIGPRPSKDHSLDRLNNNRGYEPGNVAWRTAAEQMANRRPDARKCQACGSILVCDNCREPEPVTFAIAC